MNPYLLKLIQEITEMYGIGKLDDKEIKVFAFTMMNLYRTISEESAFAISQEWMYSVDVFDGYKGGGFVGQ